MVTPSLAFASTSLRLGGVAWLSLCLLHIPYDEHDPGPREWVEDGDTITSRPWPIATHGERLRPWTPFHWAGLPHASGMMGSWPTLEGPASGPLLPLVGPFSLAWRSPSVGQMQTRTRTNAAQTTVIGLPTIGGWLSPDSRKIPLPEELGGPFQGLIE